MVFLGGFGSIGGAVLGALIIETLSLWMNTQPAFSGSIREVMLGAIFLLVVLFAAASSRPAASSPKIRMRGRAAVIPTVGPVSSAPSTPPVSSGGAR